MTVAAILRSKGTHIETIGSDASLAEAAGRMNASRIGSLVVLDEKRNLKAVLSESDVVRAVAEFGNRAAELPVGVLKMDNPTPCSPDDSVKRVMLLMTARRVRHLPVITGDALVGIVSIGDVVKRQLDDLKLEVGVLRDHALMRV